MPSEMQSKLNDLFANNGKPMHDWIACCGLFNGHSIRFYFVQALMPDRSFAKSPLTGESAWATSQSSTLMPVRESARSSSMVVVEEMKICSIF